MARAKHLLPFAMFVLVLGVAAAQAGVTAELACQDAPRAERFESILLKVSGLPAGFRGKAVRVRDVRGGLGFTRSIEGWTGGGAGTEQVIMMPLPMVAAAELPRDRWPVFVTLVTTEGVEMCEQVDVPLPPIGAAGGARRVLSVPGGGGAASRGTAAPSTIASNSATVRQPMATVRMAEADFLQAPALALAGFDVVELDGRAASSLGEDQVAALLNVGLKVVVRQTDAPAGRLGQFVWDRVPGAFPEEVRWSTPREALWSPRMVEGALLEARALQVQAEASSGLRRILLSVAPVGILLVVLARLMIRRSAMLLGVVTAALIMWTGVAIAWATMRSPPVKSEAAWVTRNAPPVTPATPLGGDALALREAFTASSSLLDRDMDIVARPGEMLWPAVVSPRQYFALDRAELSLDYTDGSRRVERLTLHVPSRYGVVIARRRSYPARLVSEWAGGTAEAAQWARDAGIEPARAQLLEAGYVRALVDGDQTPRLFTQWLREGSGGADIAIAGECWLALRFAGRHRYVIGRQAGVGPAASELVIVDCGPLEASGGPATGASSRPGS